MDDFAAGRALHPDGRLAVRCFVFDEDIEAGYLGAAAGTAPEVWRGWLCGGHGLGFGRYPEMGSV